MLFFDYLVTSGEHSPGIKIYSSNEMAYAQSSQPMTHVLDYIFVSSDVCVTRLQAVTFLYWEKQISWSRIKSKWSRHSERWEMWLVSHSHMMGGQNLKVRKNEQQKTWNLSRNIAAKWAE